MRRTVVLVGAAVVVAMGGAALRARGRVGEARGRLATASTPSVRLYDLLAGRLLGGLYDVMAIQAAAAVDHLDRPQVLEVGTGPGHLVERLSARCPRARLVGLDIDPAMLAQARARVIGAGLDGRVQLVEGDVAAMPFEDGMFDLVVSSFSVHHWPDPDAGFGEIHRVLRTGGEVLAYDLPDAWGRFETGAPGLEAAATAGGFAEVVVEPVAWPRSVRLVRRLRAAREARPGGTPAGEPASRPVGPVRRERPARLQRPVRRERPR